MKLSMFVVERAKPKAKVYRLADGHGLALQVEPTGRKLWRFRYRFEGRANMLSLGAYPEVSLAAAREKREEARKLVAAGDDPSQKRKQVKAASVEESKNTFGIVAREFLAKAKEEGAAQATLEKNTWLLEELAKPLTERPIRLITSAELLPLLQKIEKSGRKETARRLRGIMGTVFRFAISTLRAENDPTFALRGALTAPTVKHHPAITDEVKLGGLLCSIDEYDGWPTLKAALQFTALTFPRSTELRLMRRNEINWPKATWQIPAERMKPHGKLRVPHDVPLSRQALTVLRAVWDLSEGDGLVFPSVRSSKKPLSENALNSALRRMGYSKEEHTAHGFRTSASTILNERFPTAGEVIEVSLAHLEEDEVRRAYNRAKYWTQRQQLYQDWADLLDQFKLQRAA